MNAFLFIPTYREAEQVRCLPNSCHRWPIHDFSSPRAHSRSLFSGIRRNGGVGEGSWQISFLILIFLVLILIAVFRVASTILVETCLDTTIELSQLLSTQPNPTPHKKQTIQPAQHVNPPSSKQCSALQLCIPPSAVPSNNSPPTLLTILLALIAKWRARHSSTFRSPRTRIRRTIRLNGRPGSQFHAPADYA